MAATPPCTERLDFHELDEGDADFILALLNSPGFLANIGDRGVRSVEDALGYIAKGPRASYAGHGHGLWKVSLRDGGQAVGMSGLVRRDTLPHPDLGYAFLPAYCGMGLATEAGACVLDHAFGPLAVAKVLAIVQPANQGSLRVLEKLGFAADGERDFNGEMLRIFARTATGADP